MKVTRLDHIGIAVKSIAESLKVYEAMGLKSVGVEEVAEQKVRVAFLPIGETEIELLESTAPDGPVARYIEEKNGEGIQHLALRVDNLEAALAELKAQGAAHRREAPLRRGRREDRLRVPPDPRAACCSSSARGSRPRNNPFETPGGERL